MPKHGKNYRIVAAQLEDRPYTPEEALAFFKEHPTARFDETMELHLRLGVDPRHADQMVRGVVVLPRGTGKQTRILVFADGEAARIAEEAGADYVGLDDLVQKIQGGWLDFDMAIAIPQVMSKVGRLGRILGPRGLMPSPKAGTIVQPNELKRVIDEARKGRVSYRVDRTGNLHIPFGKRSFEVEALLENLAAVMDSVLRARPAAAKGAYIRKAVIAPTMGPGAKIDIPALTALRAKYV
ncbi:MAG TPA: 50S ribosomal protein L1 [Anaerolineae bacterium]|nr:50S ribosomal protein L1 [Anaerolineae bacterium]